MMGKKKQTMKRGGKVVKKRGGGMMKKDPMAMAMGGKVSPRKAMAMGATPMKGGGKVMKGKKKKVMKGKKKKAKR